MLATAIARGRTPTTKLDRCAEAYGEFCVRYPAFIDCALSLMRRPARDLQEIVSESVWLRLGLGMAGCSDQLAEVLREGVESGDFKVEDPDYMANFLWTSTLGAMHLARIRIGLRQEGGRGLPVAFTVEPEQVVRSCVDLARAAVRA